MEENKIITNIANEITNKKMKGYSSCDEDFMGANEIMVTITLNEYRRLLTKNAQLETDIANSKLWKMQEERNQLKAKLEALLELHNGEVANNEGIQV